jgi:hypothetical protein
MSGPDLHLHSTASDGTLTPAQLVERAEELGVLTISLTDHDTTAGVADALAAAASRPVTVVPGVELSAGLGGRGVHLLGYHVDHADERFCARLAELRAIRLERAERIVYALARDGFDITINDVLAIASDGAIGRAHIAQLLVASGHVASVQEAFRTLLGSSAPYFVPKPVPEPAEVIGWIGDAGGVAVLAHPGLSQVDDLIGDFAQEGLGGIEAYHGAHDALQRTLYASVADTFGLIVTGGSDFHGDLRAGGDIGSAHVPEAVTAALTDAHRARAASR